MKPESDKTLFEEAKREQRVYSKHAKHVVRTGRVGPAGLKNCMTERVFRDIEKRMDFEEKHGPVYSIDPKTGERKEIKK